MQSSRTDSQMATATPSTCRTDAAEVVTRLLELMQGLYGARFTDQWSSVDPAIIRRTWEREISGYSNAELRRGATACKSLKWPPTLPEFLILCRPPINYELAWTEAVTQMEARRTGTDKWSDPAIYWAAARIAHDLIRSPYPAMKYRWQIALDQAQSDVRDGSAGPVPSRPPALPLTPFRTTPAPPEVTAKLAALSARLSGRSP